ncbi:MAG: hypothetical protein P8Y23_13505 [Candidatus Lokiarchaeota archaeon]|jgi:hypothetical protein
MIRVRDHMISDQIRCVICRADINDSTAIFQSSVNHGVICSGCMKLFNPEEIEIALNLFILYGGYFRQYKRNKFSIIDQLIEIVGKEDKNLDIEITNMRLLHLALVHGITPKELNRSLEEFLKK